jgi:predicted DNA-binding transcriptional regulator AlpA
MYPNHVEWNRTSDGDEKMKQTQQLPTNSITGQAPPPKILTVAQVADLLQIPKSSVYEKTRSRHGGTPPLPCRRVGKYLRFFEAEVLGWLVHLPQAERIRRTRKKAA